jgi:hypothetical protein
MRKLCFVFVALLTLAAVPFHLAAQESPKPESKKAAVPLKVQVTFTENEGEKKLANLPYTFFVNAGESSPTAPWTKVRVGSRVPVYVGKDGGMQYIDIGTNIDARGFLSDEGRFDIHLNLERSWVEGDVHVPADKSSGTSGDLNTGLFKEPVIRQFKTDLNLAMRDGQTIQTTQAADPLSGRVLAITVTINAVK